MKKYIIAALALFLTAVSSFAALPTKGDWDGTSDGGKSRVVDSQTVKLTGDVNLNCTIVISSGRTLKIILDDTMTTGAKINNKVGTNGRSLGMFNIEEGGKLVIEGKDNQIITLACAGNFNLAAYSNVNISGETVKIINSVGGLVKTGNTIEMGHPAILNQGALDLKYVTIQNVCNSTLDNTQGGNYKTAGGAIVHSATATSTKLANCLVNQCLANSGSGVFIVSESDGSVNITDTEFKNCINYTTNSGLHGGVIRGWGDSKANITLTRVKIHHCYSAADAGAIYFPSNGINSTTKKQAVLTLNNCEFYNNCSEQKSGALDICANLTLAGNTANPTKVHHNYTKSTDESIYGTGIGGGIAFRGYDSGSGPDEAVNVTYNIDGRLEVYKNKALRGGGIAFFASTSVTLVNGSKFTLNLDGAKIYDNEAKYGGGVWMRNNDGGNKGYTFTLNLNSGDVYSNKATADGGGIYVYKWDVQSSSTGSGIKIYGNKAATAGGLYLGKATYAMSSGIIGGKINDTPAGNTASKDAGGIYVSEGSTFTFGKGEVSYNTAGDYGGGVGIVGGSTAKFTNGSITHNETLSGFGGGVYCNDSKLDFQAGECSSNKALGGGGICALNKAVITFSGDIKDNEAQRGGGISLNTGSKFTMNGGVISGNKAITPGTHTTTYQDRQNGYGGGIFVFNTGDEASPTTLVIDINEGSDFGLYGNTASNGGNDITSSGKGTSVTIPNVKSMELAGFPYKDAEPNWYEDYNAADANYSYGTNRDAATNARYAEQLEANTYLKHLVSFTGDSHTYTNYLNLTLGYELLHIIIEVKNLAEGETALFKLAFAPGTADEKSWPVLLKGTGESTISRTIRNLNYGRYVAVPVNAWQWKYTVSPADGYDTNISVGPEKKFTFTLTRNDTDLETDEKHVVNKLY